MSRAETRRYHSAWHRAMRTAAQKGLMSTLIHSVVSLEVEGEHNVEGLEGPFIVVANHSSHLDAPVMMTALPRELSKDLATAVAGDYFYEQTWRKAMTSLFFNSYPVDRKGKKSKRAGLSVSLLRQGVPLLIFPEGTRSRTGEMARFTPGAAALARALRVPVVPVAMVGNHEAMPVGASWPTRGRPPVKVLIGKPIRVRAGESLTGLNTRVESTVSAMFRARTATVLQPESWPADGQDGEQSAGTEARQADSSGGPGGVPGRQKDVS